MAGRKVQPLSISTPKSSFSYDAESHCSALAAAKAEREELLCSSELKELQRELSLLQQQNTQLKQQLVAPPPSLDTRGVKHLTVQDVRALPGLSARVDAKIQQLGLSDSSSGSEDPDDDGDGKRETSASAKRGKTKLRSGKTAKLTSWVLSPQLWPHSELSLSYLSKEVCYDNLTLAEFTAGYASILRLPSLSDTECNS